MLRYYWAVALDLEGALSYDGPPEPLVIDALRAVRGQGVRVLLVTGQVLADLEGATAEIDYADLGADYYQRHQDRRAATVRPVSKLTQLGYRVTMDDATTVAT